MKYLEHWAKQGITNPPCERWKILLSKEQKNKFRAILDMRYFFCGIEFLNKSLIQIFFASFNFSTHLGRIPTFGGQVLDLHALYNIVTSFGGISIVRNFPFLFFFTFESKTWRKLHFSSSSWIIINTLQVIIIKCSKGPSLVIDCLGSFVSNPNPKKEP